jgi:hypothetical protein
MMAEQRYVSISYFIKGMLGFSRATYYNHLDQPGWPQRVYPTGTKKPMLIYSECLAYQRQLEEARKPAPAAPEPEPKAPQKRRPGRPVSAPKGGQRAVP